MSGSLDRIGAVVVKEFRHLFRDPRAIGIVLLMPVFQLLVFAYAISFDVTHLPTILVDNDHTPASREYLRQYSGSTLFEVVGYSDTQAGVIDAFQANRAQVGVIVPAGFGRQLASGAEGEVAVLIDGSEPTSAKVAQAYTTGLNLAAGQEVALAWADRQGASVSGLGGLEPRLRTWYNPERRSAIFLIPGLMVVIIAIVTVQQTAVSLVRERDLGTAEQLAVSPLRRIELMLGKLLPWTGLAFVDVAAIVVLAVWLFGVPLRGDLAVLGAGAALFVFCCLGMGLVISAVAPSMEVANIASLLLAFLPTFLLSGFVFPLDQIPAVLQWISALFPARYMVAISRGVFLKGSGWDELWPQFAALAAYAALALAAASVLYSRRSR
ncbi:MAG: ABC transporter permease [Propionicimonas sp.]|nr:ABC transporter permease [Propionicimonas sp.]